MGNLSNYRSIGTQTHWGQCHLVSLDVIGQCFDCPIFSGPASCLRHVFCIFLCWGWVCIFFQYKSLTPLLEWEDSSPRWGLMVFGYYSANQAWWGYIKTQQTLQSLHSMSVRLALSWSSIVLDLFCYTFLSGVWTVLREPSSFCFSSISGLIRVYRKIIFVNIRKTL